MGSVINFNLVFPPDAGKGSECNKLGYIESECELLKQKLEVHGISVKTFEFLKLNQRYEQYLNITEFVISVQAVVRTSSQIGNAYNYLRDIWSTVSSNYDAINVPLLSFSEKSAFKNRRIAEHRNMSCKSIMLGVFLCPGSFVSYASLPGSLLNNINFYHDTCNVDIIFLTQYLIVISYNFIRKIVVQYTPHCVKMYIDLFHSPLIYRKEQKYTKMHEPYEINHRVLEIRPYLQASVIGKANILLLQLNDIMKAEEVINRLHYRCKEIVIHYGNIHDSESPPPLDPEINFQYFSCNYLLTAILKRNFYLAEQCRKKPLMPHLYSYSEMKPLEKALSNILFILDCGNFFCFWQALPLLYNYYKEEEKEGNSFEHYIIPEKSRLIRRVTITPTRILLYPPEIMFENRVLRNFDSEFALRVNFRDDNVSRLSWNALYAEEAIFDSAIRKQMISGLKIGNRHYKFLAWSNSQIRDHGVWMYARDLRGIEVSDIRQWMGDFSDIRSVPKYMARMGQCFSQTVDTVSVPLQTGHVKIEDDITGGYDFITGKPYCFSDGIGRISMSLAKKVHDAVGHDKHCSAFQIRYGGCKGMLVADPTLLDTDIVFRKSMVKFHSPKNIRLEIAKTSAPTPLYLNRPFITVLNDMGIKPPVFLRMQEDMLNTLMEMLLNDEVAAEYLLAKTPSQFFQYKELCGSGVGLTTEPFFRSLLLALNRHHVEKIKSKANIAVDPSYGRNMLGVLDETGILQYGQVFVQYTTDVSVGETTSETTILKGTVLVTKNPCMHPGDVRKFQAVDIPALHHIVDCIVFPQKGTRPHPNEMAGSDLDGDEYAVLWKKELIFKRENYEPCHYPSYSAFQKMYISEEDMVNFLVEYIRNDQVGVIANAHLAIADKESVFSSKSINIAKKFSVAVDFAKNGKSEHLSYLEKPQLFPDFMEKYYKQTYKSNKALGKMFRVSKDVEAETENTSYKYSHIQVDPTLVYPGWENYEQDAIQSRNKYISLLYKVLQTYGVIHEAEAFSGAFSRFHCRFQERQDRAEVEKVVIGCVKTLFKNMKKEFMLEFDANPNEMTRKLLQKASAWYMVTYREGNAAFLSFPWIVSGLLANIRIISLSKTITPFYTPLLEKLDTIIMESTYANLLFQLPEVAQSQLSKCRFCCEKEIVVRALRVMIQWAVDMFVIQDPGYSRVKGFLFIDTFIRLFLHVAALQNYILGDEKKAESTLQVRSITECSSAALCVAFLRFCVKLRFCNKLEVKEVLPFHVYKYKWLSNKAMHSYHKMAVTGVFDVLSFDSSNEHGLIEMKPEHIESSIFSSGPLSEQQLVKAEQKLMDLTGAVSVTLAEKRTIKKVTVSAYGTDASLLSLKAIIRKEPSVLRQYLFSSV